MEYGLTMKTQKWRFVSCKRLPDKSVLIFAEGRYINPQTGVMSSSGDYRVDLAKENATKPSFVMITDKACGNKIAIWSKNCKLHDEMLLYLRGHASLVHSYNQNASPEYGVITETLFDSIPDNFSVNISTLQ